MRNSPVAKNRSRCGRTAGLVAAWTVALAVLGLALLEPRLREVLARGPDPATEPAPLRPGWGRVTAGLPSGADPIAPRRPPAPEKLPAEPAPIVETFEPSAPADFELTVAPGAVLSKIVQAHYGTMRGGLLQRVTWYNGLSDPNNLIVGQKLSLPSREVLERAVPGPTDESSSD